MCTYAAVLLSGKEQDTVTVGLQVFENVVNSEEIATAVGDCLLSAQDVILQQYSLHKYRQTVSDLFSTFVRRQLVSETVIQTMAKGSTFLRLLKKLLKKSIAARYFPLLEVLGRKRFPLLKLGAKTENRSVSEVP